MGKICEGRKDNAMENSSVGSRFHLWNTGHPGKRSAYRSMRSPAVWNISTETLRNYTCVGKGSFVIFLLMARTALLAGSTSRKKRRDLVGDARPIHRKPGPSFGT
jgi:hypothetical protein